MILYLKGWELFVQSDTKEHAYRMSYIRDETKILYVYYIISLFK